MKVRAQISLAGVVLAGLMVIARPDAARADFFPSNASINYAVSDQAIVGYDNQTDLDDTTNGTSPIVSLIIGGSTGGDFDVYNGSTVNVTGGEVGGDFNAYNNSNVNIGGGTFDNQVNFNDNSTATISAGATITSGTSDSGIFVEPYSTLDITGGSIDTTLDVIGTTAISGGDFTGSFNGITFYDYSNTSFTFIGTDLSAQNIAPPDDGFQGDNAFYALSGNLADGNSVTGDVVEVYGALEAPGEGQSVMFTLEDVPEPASLAMVILGVLGLCALRPRRGVAQ